MRVACGAVQNQLGILLGFARDLLHRIDEEIQFFLRFALGWLNHQRAGNDQRKRNGVGMKAVIDKPLGDIARS